ncbi:chromosomal replication initiator DnaA [Pseudosulfitobacter pseudonitzschiae]|uniref:chromosomal replication initiator DnaA n=1 Tax=Pseudosulfitobacter pseudonitzschiae TaxID=1402135 RepID=UPI001AF657F3|nr:chromosomal replication initiator DnaA [Pseudosulfitobacter pseudonitzschiae]MBM1815276.1 chromosomal replication initiator DnaA [Pseudosulfitobacter pseudonitzschiae]MBM1832267.1 chromosomal replication initiator DnaA [Pseudosulfitobacter pseudonitzschiae]MBM1837135.1 chromosomal replication initiator DnaA [Pseudosulfitobacter pseudonitzschiae]MBM1841981.1 chromosomal replication initiator DnaA [Pseudosulfitobacter pseudonitzschiae]MBM1846849.1 chromosomal replication initiator DnaA [Pseud
MSQQLSFDLPVRTALGRDDFMVSPGNAVAVSLIEAWDNWPGGKLVLTGPPGAGKTHLTHVWAGMAGARIVAARDLAEADIPDLAGGPIAVEDVPQIAADADAMTALFHLHNLALANGHPLLMTGRGAPVHWGLGLPDLQSRVGGTPAAILELPDDSLLTAVLAKLFADRQLKPRVDVIPYLAMHMERSFDAARRMVAVLDAESLSAQKPLTRAMAAKVLGREAE